MNLDTVAIVKLQIAGTPSRLTNNSHLDPSATAASMEPDPTGCARFPIALCTCTICTNHSLKCVGKTNIKISTFIQGKSNFKTSTRLSLSIHSGPISSPTTWQWWSRQGCVCEKRKTTHQNKQKPIPRTLELQNNPTTFFSFVPVPLKGLGLLSQNVVVSPMCWEQGWSRHQGAALLQSTWCGQSQRKGRAAGRRRFRLLQPGFRTAWPSHRGSHDSPRCATGCCPIRRLARTPDKWSKMS